MSGKGHRRLRLCSKKNYERKKYQARSHDVQNDARPDASQSSVESSDNSVSTITELSNGIQLLNPLNGTSPISKANTCLRIYYYTVRLDSLFQ